MKGEAVFYRWTGEEPAIVELRPVGQLGWIVDEIKGPENRTVGAATRHRVLAELASWGCFTDRNIIESLRKFGGYCLLGELPAALELPAEVVAEALAASAATASPAAEVSSLSSPQLHLLEEPRLALASLGRPERVPPGNLDRA